jgi:AraC family transcriptional regulator
MSYLESMYQAVQYMERHLQESISVQDVADAIGYSLYHFSRTFNRAVGHSPYDYLVRRRLSESARELVASEKRIIDIAMAYQFNNPETYSRAFRRMFGVLPSRVRHSGSIASLTLRSEVTLPYLEHINKGDALRPALVELGAIHLVGMVTLAERDRGTIAALWEAFGLEAEVVPNRLHPAQYCGISFSSADGPSGTFHMVGVVVDSIETVPPALVGKAIPPHRYARFVHKGLSRDAGMTLDYAYQTWLPKSGASLAVPLEIEVYGSCYTGSDDPNATCEILIPTDLPEREVSRSIVHKAWQRKEIR